MLRPGADTGYTRMLMFSCLASIPLSFFMAMVAGRIYLIFELDIPGDWSDFGFWEWYILFGMSLLLLLPVALLVGLGFMLELRNALMFFLFMVPVLTRLAFAPVDDSLIAAFVQSLLFLVSIVAGALVVLALDRWGTGTKSQEMHLQKILPGYGTAANMFFGVCVFALANQLIEFIHAMTALLN